MQKRGVRTKPINQFDLQGKFIKRFDSINEAAEELKCSVSGISKVLVGAREKSMGYIWRYEGEDAKKYKKLKESKVINVDYLKSFVASEIYVMKFGFINPHEIICFSKEQCEMLEVEIPKKYNVTVDWEYNLIEKVYKFVAVKI